MTRINLVPPSELCDQHLLAEHRELTRIPNAVVYYGADLNLADRPSGYVLGTGHVRFFYDKLLFLHARYQDLHRECLLRGFQVGWNWPECLVPLTDLRLWDWYEPTPEALAINREHLAERMPERARFTPHRTEDKS